MAEYRYNIYCMDIIPPLLEYKFAGKVGRLTRLDPEGPVPVAHEFGETWGATREEAKIKMEKKIQEWIESQNRNQ